MTASEDQQNGRRAWFSHDRKIISVGEGHTPGPTYIVRGLCVGPLVYVSQRHQSTPWTHAGRHVFVGRLSLAVGVGPAIEEGYAEACGDHRMRGRWLRKRWPAALLAWEGPKR